MKNETTSVILNRNKRIAITGALCALTILMGIPGLHLGYIQISPTVSLTIMHIPVVLAAALAGLPGAFATGLVFGVTSLVNAAANPSGVLDPLFVNPLCSVLPRVIFGIAAWGIYRLFCMIPYCPKAVASSVSAVVSSLVHSVVVIGSMYIFLGAQISQAMGGLSYAALMALILPGSLMEAVAAALVCGLVIGSITVSASGKSKLFSEEDEQE